jgi:hypothetical protein
MKRWSLVLTVASPRFAVPGWRRVRRPAQEQPPPRRPRPFPEGAKIAYVNIQRIASESAEGRAATAKVKALNDKKVSELGERRRR